MSLDVKGGKPDKNQQRTMVCLLSLLLLDFQLSLTPPAGGAKGCLDHIRPSTLPAYTAQLLTCYDTRVGTSSWCVFGRLWNWDVMNCTTIDWILIPYDLPRVSGFVLFGFFIHHPV